MSGRVIRLSSVGLIINKNIMVLFLFLGALIGITSVIFAMQNTAIVTLTFFDWQVAAPLAVIVLGSAALGIGMTLLAMLVRIISDALNEYTLRREERKAETAVVYETGTTEERRVSA